MPNSKPRSRELIIDRIFLLFFSLKNLYLNVHIYNINKEDFLSKILQLEKLRTTIGKYPPGAAPTSSCSAGNDQENGSSLEFYTGIFGLEKSRIMEVVNQAMEELKKMATAGEPLWIQSVETDREILNYDEYVKEFSVENSSNARPKRSIEASRETGVVFVDLPRLVQSFMDVVRSFLYLFFKE